MYFRNILLAVGIAALLIGTALAVLWAQQGAPSREEAASAVGRESVLVAAGDLRTGTLLRAEDLAWKALPPQAIPPAAMHMQPGAERSYIGAVVRRDFAAGEPLVPGGVVMPGARDFLAAVLSPGMRAVSLPVDAASSDGGLIQPGDYVDAILAQSVTGAGDSHSAVSETVLQNVRVVAVDQAFAPGTQAAAASGGFGTPESRIPKTITLEMDEEDAKRLLTAAQLGKVTLAIRALAGAYAAPLRPREDTAPVWASDVSAAMRGGPARAAHSSAGGVMRVTILRGSKTETQ